MYGTLHRTAGNTFFYIRVEYLFTKIDHNLKKKTEHAVGRITGLSPLADGDVKQYSCFGK